MSKDLLFKSCAIFCEGPLPWATAHKLLFFQGFFQNSVSRIANCIIVDIVMLLLANS